MKDGGTVASWDVPREVATDNKPKATIIDRQGCPFIWGPPAVQLHTRRLDIQSVQRVDLSTFSLVTDMPVEVPMK